MSALAADQPLGRIREARLAAAPVRAGYAREGYSEGYRNLPVAAFLPECRTAGLVGCDSPAGRLGGAVLFHTDLRDAARGIMVGACRSSP